MSEDAFWNPVDRLENAVVDSEQAQSDALRALRNIESAFTNTVYWLTALLMFLIGVYVGVML